MKSELAITMERRPGVERRLRVAASGEQRAPDRQRVESETNPPGLYPAGKVAGALRPEALPSEPPHRPLRRYAANWARTVVGFARRILSAVDEYRRRRRTLRELARLDDRLLRDIGVSPEEMDIIRRARDRSYPLQQYPGTVDWYDAYDTRRPSL